MRYILIILLFITFSVQSQEIGDEIEYLLKNKQEFNLSHEKFTENYLELYSFKELSMSVYLIDYKTRKVFGVDYVYLDVDSLTQELKIAVKDAYSIGYGMWIRDKIYITATNQCISLRDDTFITKRARRNYKKKQREANGVFKWEKKGRAR